MIQALIPLSLKAVEEALPRDVTALAGRGMRIMMPAPGWRAGARSADSFISRIRNCRLSCRACDLRAGTELPLATYQPLLVAGPVLLYSRNSSRLKIPFPFMSR